MNNNNFLIGTLFLMLAPVVLPAQSMTGDQDLSLSYGRESGTEILKTSFQKFGESHDIIATTGNIFVTYRYSFAPIFSLGVTIGTESFSFDQNDGEYANPGSGHGSLNNVLVARYNINVTTLAFEPRITYLNRKRVKLYSFAGLGVRLFTQSETTYQPGYQPGFQGGPGPVFINTQMTPIGIAYGNKFSGYFEIGMGYKGLINGGLTYRFSRKEQKKEIGNK